jgi:hypothetical protein
MEFVARQSGLIDLPCQGRLTTETGVPVSGSDRTAQTSLRFTPYFGDRVGLFNGSRWSSYAFSELSLTVPATIHRPFDVFLYDNSGTLTLESVNYNQTTGSITSITAANPPVVTSAGHGLSNGDQVIIEGANNSVGTYLNGFQVTVANITTNTFEIEFGKASGLVASTTGTWYKVNGTRATALVTQNGRLVKSGETNKLYVGSAMTTGTSGRTEDSESARLVWNYYNRELRHLKKTYAAPFWSYSLAQFRPADNNLSNRVRMFIGVQGAQVDAGVMTTTYSGNQQNCDIRLGENSIGVEMPGSIGGHLEVGPTGHFFYGLSRGLRRPTAGSIYYQWLEYATSGNSMFFYAGNSLGIIGTVEA